jgi:hypothetical protein
MNVEVLHLADFLLARIAAQEAAIVNDAPPDTDPFDPCPAGSLTECQVNRAIVIVCSAAEVPTHCRIILGLMSLPYANHPDYREQWAATGQDIVRQRSPRTREQRDPTPHSGRGRARATTGPPIM